MPKRKSRRVAKAVKVKRPAVITVAIPKGHVPIIATDTEKGIVNIVPVPKAAVKEHTWFEWLFGTYKD